MRWLLAVVVLLGRVAPAAAQDLDALLGRRLTDVRLEVAGVTLEDGTALGLVETRVGEPLTMAHVRLTIDHLVTLGRFADIRVFAEPDGDGVRLRYGLVPLDRIARVRFEGTLGLDHDLLRATLTDRFGTAPAASRRDEMVAALVDRYHAHGFAAARVAIRLTPDGQAGDVTAIVTAVPGPQALVGRAVVEGAGAPANLLDRLGLVAGRPLDRETLDERVRVAEETLRDDRYYEAMVSAEVADAGPGVADVTVRVDLGARVRVEFTGDPLPESRRKALVPIESLRSVEEEVVEDASRNIEQHFRLEGYRLAESPAERRRENGTLVITFAIRKGPLHVLGPVEVDGAEQLPRAELEPLLKLQPGEPFVDARVSTTAAAIAELYRVRGFSTARVTPQFYQDTPTGTPPKVAVSVRFAIDEGIRTTVTTVRFDGATAVPPAVLLEGMALTPGKPFYRPQQAIDREIVERRYRNLGYQRAAVEPRAVFAADGTTVDLTYVVREGPQTLVDHIVIAGSTRTSADLIRSELTLTPGSPLGYDALIESQQRLSALGLFRRVRLSEAVHASDDVNRDVLVEVEDAPATSASYGGGLEVGRRTRRGDDGTVTDQIDVAPRAFFEVTRRNLFGKNRSLSLLTSASLRPTDPGVDADPDEQGGYGLNQYRVVGTFREPRAFGTQGDVLLTAFIERGIRSSFNFDRQGVRAEYAKRFPNRLVVVGRYAYDYTELFDAKIAVQDQLLIDRLFPQVLLSSVFGSVARDSRNDVLDPERGTILGTDLEFALPALGSEVGFARAFSQAFVYRRLPGARPFVVAAGARLGLARGFATQVAQVDADGQPVVGPDGTPVVATVTDLPASERFFAGGATTVRGFALDRLGTEATLNDDGFPTGGNAMVVLNLELRAPYIKGVGLVSFLDVGNVFRRVGNLDVGDLRASAGVGLRYRSPLGPLRLDIGFKLDRRDFTNGSERGSVYHLSLGQAF